ncbi:MAG: hypothetical protein NT069_33025 [Planctomycetota bacterium]|nr:hypothetical protein [Planctomycetota bacterium]
MTTTRRELTPYEADQVHRIAGWKAESPGFIPGLIEKVTHPLVKLAEKAISKEAIAEAIEKAYIESELFIHQERISQRAGVNDIRELRQRDLASCDRLADEFAKIVAEKGLITGALVGGSGPLATMLYVKSLITQTLRVIHTTGLC